MINVLISGIRDHDLHVTFNYFVFFVVATVAFLVLYVQKKKKKNSLCRQKMFHESQIDRN